MATDVLIDPASGQIYWNDGTGSPESIAIKGDAINTISFTGYSASFSPGSTPAGALTLVTVKDSAGTDALIPGTTGYNLGSSTLRWNTFSSNANLSGTLVVSDSTISSSLLTGSTKINGGIAISGNASIGQSLNFYNTAATFYTGFRAGTISANTLYTLPTAFPGSASFLQSDASGTLTWVGSIGTATTATNVNVVSATTSASHPVLFTPSAGTASGAAVSTESTFVYNPSTDILSVSGLAITSGTASTSPTTGALVVSGGVGIAKTSYFGQDVKILGSTASTSSTTGALTVTGGVGISGRLHVGTSSTSIFDIPEYSVAGFAGSSDQAWVVIANTKTNFAENEDAFVRLILKSSDSSGAISVGNTSNGGNVSIEALYGLSFIAGADSSLSAPNMTFDVGTVFISNIYGDPTSSTGYSTGALVVVGGAGIALTSYFGQDVKIQGTTASGSTTTGALVVTGGVGIGGSIFTAPTSKSSISGVSFNNSRAENGFTINASSSYTFNIQDASNNQRLNYHADSNRTEFTGNNATHEIRLIHSNNSGYTGLKSNSSGTVTYTFPAGDGSNGQALTTNGSATLSWTTITGGAGGGGTGVQPGGQYEIAYYTATGASVNGSPTFKNDTAAAKVTITHTTASTSTTTGALVISGGVGIGGSLYTSTGSSSSVSGVTLANGNVSASTYNKLTVSSPASSATLTIADGSSLITSGANSLTLTTTATTNATFPSGTKTLVATDVTSLASLTTASSLNSIGTIATGVWNGTAISSTYGGTGLNNSGQSGILKYTTGTGSLVAAPTGAIVGTTDTQTLTNKTYNSVTITAPASSATLTLANLSSLITSGGHSLTFNTTATTSVTLPTTGTLATTSNKLSDFAATTSLELFNTITGETGSGALVFATSPDFTTSVTTPSTTFSVFNATATTINAFGAATVMSIGAATGKATFNSTDNSSSTTTGGLVVLGGAGIAKSVSIGGRLQMFNGANFTAFVSSASGNTVYTLPATSPATGSSVLQSTSAGVMSWVPMTAGGGPSGTINSSTVNNIAFYSAATTLSGDDVASGNYFFYNGTNTGLNIAHEDNEFNPTASTKLLTVGTGATNYSTNRKALAVISTNNAWTNGDLLVLGVGALGSDVRFGVDWTGRVQIGTPGTGFTLPSTNGTSGQVLTANTDGKATWTTVAGGGAGSGTVAIPGAQYQVAAYYSGTGASVSGSTTFTNNTSTGVVNITHATESTSSTTGALTVTGGAGIAKSLFVGTTLSVGTNPSYNIPNILASFVSTVDSYNQLVIQNKSSGTTASANLVVNNNSSTDSTTYGEIGMNSSTFTGSGALNAPNAVYIAAHTAPLVLGTVTSNPIRFVVNSGVTDTIYIHEAGTAISVFTNLDLRSQNDIRFFNSGNTFNTALQAGSNTVNYTLSLPTAPVGAGSSVIVTGSDGQMYFAAPGSGIAFSSATANTPIIRAKRPIALQFSAGYTPAAAGADTVILRVPESATDGTTALTYNLRRFQVRVETPSAGSSRLQLERSSTDTGAFTLAATGSSHIGGLGVTIVGAGIYLTSVTTFSGSLVTSGNLLRLNWTLLNATHASFSVQLLLEEV